MANVLKGWDFGATVLEGDAMYQKGADGGVIWLVLLAVAVWYFFFRDGECKQYASKYSCEFVEKKASYEVYYWVDLSDERTERYIGSVVGLAACEANAMRYAASINQAWNSRRYICVLNKDGQREKHRYFRVLAK